MIKLAAEPYCSKCPDFEPKTDKVGAEMYGNSFLTDTDTVVYCKDRERCARIAEWLRKGLGKDA